MSLVACPPRHAFGMPPPLAGEDLIFGVWTRFVPNRGRNFATTLNVDPA
jgi:hypothetical protein